MPASSFVEIVSSLLVPVIAIIGAVIALQQYRINKQRLKHELYDRRMIVFKHMKTYLSEIMRDGSVSYDRAMKFNFDTSEAIFLLDDKINARIKKIYEKSIDLAQLQEQLYPKDGSRGLPVGGKRSEVSNKKDETLKWLTYQLVELKPLFSKHLGLKG
ncbi:MAG: hypothetical protein ACQERD_05600 [Campylobacterota bacterium]